MNNPPTPWTKCILWSLTAHLASLGDRSRQGESCRLFRRSLRAAQQIRTWQSATVRTRPILSNHHHQAKRWLEIAPLRAAGAPRVPWPWGEPPSFLSLARVDQSLWTGMGNSSRIFGVWRTWTIRGVAAPQKFLFSLHSSLGYSFPDSYCFHCLDRRELAGHRAILVTLPVASLHRRTLAHA